MHKWQHTLLSGIQTHEQLEGNVPCAMRKRRKQCGLDRNHPCGRTKNEHFPHQLCEWKEKEKNRLSTQRLTEATPHSNVYLNVSFCRDSPR